MKQDIYIERSKWLRVQDWENCTRGRSINDTCQTRAFKCLNWLA